MDKRIQKAFHIIKQHYQKKLLLNQLAEKVGLSSFHLQRLFKDELGESPAECISRTRLERARHLLYIDPHISMSALAADCGFSSLSVFSRAYTKYFGHAPTVLAATLKKQIVNPVAGSFKVEIVYQPEVKIVYEYTSMHTGELTKDFQKALAKCKKMQVMTGNKFLGVLTHIAFHGRKDQLNYYAGVEVVGPIPQKYADNIFTIPAGKYATFLISGNYNDLLKTMLLFKTNWLDSSRYNIRDIFAFEEHFTDGINNNSLKRMVYIPLKPK